MARRLPGVHIIVPIVVVAAAVAVGAASLTLPPPISGPLEPGLVPGLLSIVALASALVVFPQRPYAAKPDDAPTPGWRPLAAATLAVAILAFGTRPLGVAATTLLAATITAAGVANVSPWRALRIGIAFAVGIAVLLTIVSRQPLPIMPQGFGW